jgi:hypothetical protein
LLNSNQGGLTVTLPITIESLYIEPGERGGGEECGVHAFNSVLNLPQKCGILDKAAEV